VSTFSTFITLGLTKVVLPLMNSAALPLSIAKLAFIPLSNNSLLFIALAQLSLYLKIK
jgi:hypothetical protein